MDSQNILTLVNPLEIQFVTIVFCWSGIRATHWGNLLLTPYAPDHDSIGQAATSLIWQSVAKMFVKLHLNDVISVKLRYYGTAPQISKQPSTLF